MRSEPSIRKTKLPKQKHSLSYDRTFDRTSSFLTTHHYSLAHEVEAEPGPGMFLDVVREELISRGSNNKMMNTDRSRSNMLNSDSRVRNIQVPTFE